MIEDSERVGDSLQAQQYRTQLGLIEEQLINKNEERFQSILLRVLS
jgi:hypothetical protein